MRPPLAPVVIYLILACLTLLLPELSVSERELLTGRHATFDFLKQTVLWSTFWCLPWGWWVHSSRRLELEPDEKIPSDWFYNLLVGVAPVALLAAWCKPFLSVDTSYYVAYGRQIVEYGLNPYEVNLYASAGDPVVAAVPKTWWENVAFYGPVALTLYTLANLLTPRAGLLSIVKTLKFFWVPFYGFLGMFLNKYWKEEPSRYSLVLAVVANPVMLWFCLVDGHVDLLIACFLLATVLALKLGKPTVSALALGCAAAVKIVGIVAFPACLCLWYRRSLKECLRFLATFIVFYGGMYALVRGGEYPGVIEFTKKWNNPGAGMIVPKLMAAGEADLFWIQNGSNIFFYGCTLLVCVLVLGGFAAAQPALPVALCMGALLLTRTYFQPWYTLWFWPLLWLDFGKDRDFFISHVGWTTVMLVSWLVGWESKGWFVGGAAILALTHAVWASKSHTRNTSKKNEGA